MPNFKNNLIELMKKAVFELYSGDMIFHKITESGFYCDFDMPDSLNPDKAAAIMEWLSGKDISYAYEMSSFSGAYLDGDGSNKMVQRIYVSAFKAEGELNEHREKLAVAAEHDHKKIGSQLALFSTSEEIGQGLPMWHPKGATIRFLLEQFSQLHTC